MFLSYSHLIVNPRYPARNQIFSWLTYPLANVYIATEHHHLEILEEVNQMLPSGTQTWQWKIHYLYDFPIETPISRGFPSLPRLMPPEGNNPFAIAILT